MRDGLSRQSIDEISDVVCGEVNELLRQRDRAFEALVDRVTECERLHGIEQDELYKIEQDYITSGGDDGLLWQFQEDNHVTESNIIAMESRRHKSRQ